MKEEGNCGEELICDCIPNALYADYLRIKYLRGM